MLTGTELPNLNTVFSRLSRIPIQSEESVEVVENSAMLSNTRAPSNSGRGRGTGQGGSTRGGGRNTSRKEEKYAHCEYCHVTGHTEDKCWPKYGKPDWVKQSSNVSSIPTTSNVASIAAPTSSACCCNSYFQP